MIFTVAVAVFMTLVVQGFFFIAIGYTYFVVIGITIWLRCHWSAKAALSFLMASSTPGVLAVLGYYVVDHDLLLGRFRPSVKAFVDQNFLLWASVVLPSILIFVVCVIIMILEMVNPFHWGRQAKHVRFWLAVAWACALLWSVLSLFLFRSSARHGPDAVGEEVFRFLLPLAVATLVSLGFANAHNLQSSFPRFSLLAATVVFIFIEIVIYSLVIVR